MGEYRVGGVRGRQRAGQRRGARRGVEMGVVRVCPARHPTVFVSMMEDVPETQGEIFGLC